MTTQARATALPAPPADDDPLRIARSARAGSGLVPDLGTFHRWLDEQRGRSAMEVRTVPLDALTDWRTDPATGNITHRTGRFFSVEGLDAHVPGAAVEWWRQPVLHQPEVGILGILAKEFDGVLHFLMQAKAEPGNHNGLQLSPTVQATRSNYTRVHQGAEVPYLSYFRAPSRHRVLADVRQSEQGSWFHRKRNRNMVVEVTGAVELREGFRWLTLGQLHRLLAADDLVNMDTRSVLSCLPLAGSGLTRVLGPAPGEFAAALVRSCDPGAPTRHGMGDLLHWITDVRARRDAASERIPLREVSRWRRRDGRISHESGLFFDVIGVDVTATGREVRSWSQPMIRPCGTGVIAFLVKPIGEVLHLLVQVKSEPGYVDVAELAPTVQCTPANYAALPAAARPPYLDGVLEADPARIRFDAVHAEEGGRFHHARNRYLIVEADGDLEAGPEHRWMSTAQLTALLRHSHYVNVQARCLIACLHSLSGRSEEHA